jgi:valyl-tRNA synthetase
MHLMADFPKIYQHQEHEGKIYQAWEAANLFAPRANNDKEPFSVLMPPPNANASLHAGHAMYAIQDIVVRFKRMQGHPTVWFPGTDHAGYETQYVYEKYLAKQGSSRFQFDRATLYRNIEQFVKDNSGLIVEQMKRLGFSADWSRQTFTLDQSVVDLVYSTFGQMAKDGMIYRDNYLVNYCPKCGTSFADLEIAHEERVSPLYYVRYRFADGEPRIVGGQTLAEIVVATVRPETIFADVAVAFHPDDPRAVLAGELLRNPLTHATIPIITDEAVVREFGTGVLKITPAHDPIDFAVGKRHQLPMLVTINTFGKIDLDWLHPDHEPLQSRAEMLKTQFHGLSVVNARQKVVELLQAENGIEKIDEKYVNNVAVCYKAKHAVEPLPYPNWFVHMDSLAKLGLQAVDDGEVQLIPHRFVTQYQQWLNNIRDWPISRQVVWGIRIPVWYHVDESPSILVTFLDKNGDRHHATIGEALAQGFSLDEIRAGLQIVIAPIEAKYVIQADSPGDRYIPETDTFDTWFSSGQWPLATTHFPDGADFKNFYPTSFLDTMWDILFFWVARMIMLGKYLTGSVPFRTVYLHSMVTDAKGAKMSKSKGNVVNPIELVDQFGADALRLALIAGAAPGNPVALSVPKVKGYRNFANKIWNIGRFVWMNKDQINRNPLESLTLQAADQTILADLQAVIRTTTENLEKYRFSEAALDLYDFIWNRFANTYLEENKSRPDLDVSLAVTQQVFLTSIHLLHPFMPFVTEAVWQELMVDVTDKNSRYLMVQPWPISAA